MNGLIPIEREGQRVLLTSQLAEGYETTPKVIANNFSRNRERYQEGKHFFVLEGEAKQEFLNHPQFEDGLKKAQKLYLWTEKGALLHAKSLNTDRAWEVYDYLVETYFRMRETTPPVGELSPELQMFKRIFDSVARAELEQKRQAERIDEVDRKVDGIREVVALNPQSWREDCRKLLARIAQIRGGGGAYREVNAECFALIDERAGVSLQTRLTNKRRRMADEGVCKSRRDRLTKIDVIEDDKKLIEIYISTVKEMAVRYGADIRA